MTKQHKEAESITGKRFDSPLYVVGEISGEPERYLAEKPYELSKYEFSILRKGKFKSDFWFQLSLGATIGFILAVIGKTLNALVQKQTPSIENWELWSILAGSVSSIVRRFWKKSSEEKEFQEISRNIDQHFKETPKRRIHVKSRKEGQR